MLKIGASNKNKTMTRRQRIVRAALSSLILGPVLAQASVLQLGTDNDIIFKSDGDYTGGLFLGYSSRPKPKDVSSGLANWLDINNAFYSWSSQLQIKAWTPSEIRETTPQPNERPYAGTLTANLGGNIYNSSKSLNLGIKAGVLGPSSKADIFQKKIHKWTGSSSPEGWSYQVKNQAIVDLSAEYDHLLIRTESNHEISGHGRLVAGNFQPEVAAGIGWRWGNDLGNQFNAAGLRPWQQRPQIANSKESFWYLYGSIEARYRFRDLTVTGETLQPVHPVSLHKTQGSGAVGVVAGFGSVGMSFSVMADTRSFKEDKDKLHSMGMLTLFWQF